MRSIDFQLLMLFWNLGLVDTLGMIKLCVNCGSQYLGVVLSSAAGNTTDLGVKSLLEPILGLGTSFNFVRSAATIVERRQRIATLASFLAASGGALTTDPTTNAAMGAAIASKISYMKAIMSRGGSEEIVEHYLIPGIHKFLINPIQERGLIVKKVVSPTQLIFQTNCELITKNIFSEHSTRRYTQVLGRKLGLSKNGNGFMKASKKLTLAKAASSYFLYLMSIVPAVLVSLLLIREAKRKHYHMMSQAHEKAIDVEFISID